MVVLPTDNFQRANENPISGSGNLTNAAAIATRGWFHHITLRQSESSISASFW
jgi:hypothetical protein